MPAAPDQHEAHDYAERIRERLPRRLQELREAARLSMDALWRKSGVSRDTISRIESGETLPGVHLLVRGWVSKHDASDSFSCIIPCRAGTFS